MPAARTVPHDRAAEEAVVASVLVDDGTLAKVRPLLEPGDFFDERCRCAFEAALAVAERGEGVNAITVAHELHERGLLERAGGVGFLSRIVADLPTPIGVEDYADIVRHDATYRQLIGASAQIAQLAYQGGPDPDAVLGRVRALVETVMPAPRPAPPAPGPVLACIADVEREEVAWRWTARLPLGKLVLFAGDPGVGKSWASLAIAAAVTTGAPLPGDHARHAPACALILTAEDGLGDTVRPRLESMGADLELVTALTAVRDASGRERAFDLTADLGHIDAALSVGGYGLVVIDPLNAYLGTVLDTHRDAALRSVLTPLASLAERYRCAVVAVAHLTKSQRDRAIYRPQGAIAYIAAARVAWLVGQNPENERERVVAVIKNNLAPPVPSLAFEIAEGRFLWRGESAVSVGALLGPDEGNEERSSHQNVVEFLREVLAEGPLSPKEVQDAADVHGYTPKQVRRAREALGVRVEPVREPGKRGIQGWVWSLDAPHAHIGPGASKLAFESENSADGREGGHLNRGSTCAHRPLGEIDQLWAMGAATWGDDAAACSCCAGPARSELVDQRDRCPTCRAGSPAPARGGHLVRYGLDLGGELEAAS